METSRDLNRHTPSAVPTVVVKNPAAQQAIHVGSLRRTLTRVAWLGIGLGVLMEMLLVIIQFGAVRNLEPFLAELTGKVTWSLFVCAGLAVGEAVSKDNPFWAGIAGLTTAPLAFILARGVHKTAAEMIGVAAPGTSPWVPVTAGLRGIEYMCLGLLLYWLGKRASQRALPYLATGLTVGLIFGLTTLLMTPTATTTMAGLLSWSVNELVFPVGCSLVLFTATALEHKLPTSTPTETPAQ